MSPGAPRGSAGVPASASASVPAPVPVPAAGPTAPPSGAALWDEHASWWRATFTDGADIEYEGEIIPLARRELGSFARVLDLGCGEGQVARALAAGGASLIGLDPSRNQLANASALGGGPSFVCAAGEWLPIATGSLDAVLCCLAIEHSDDTDAVLEEVARVLAPGGTFLLLINHPMYQGPGSGFVDDQILGEHYWRVGPYLTEQVSVEEVDSNVSIPFAHRPLSRYVNPLAALDVLLVAMFEPPPLEAFLATSVDRELEGAIPRLLAMRFEHRPAPARPAARRTAGRNAAGRGAAASGTPARGAAPRRQRSG